MAVPRCASSASVVILCIAVLAGPSLAADSTAARGNYLDMDLDDLLSMKVTTVSKTEEDVSAAPGVISVLTQDDMVRFGARTLKDVLMRMPSINMSTTYIGDRSCVAIRGDQMNPAANHILLLINGRPVREAQEGGIKGEVYETFPVASIERVELIRGPGSVLYGSNAFSGVINVITKDPETNGSVFSVQGGVPGQFKGTGNVAYQIGDFGIAVGGQYKYDKPWDVEFQAGDTVFRDMSIPDNGFGGYAELGFRGLKYMTSYNQWENYYIMQKYIPRTPPSVPAGSHAYGEGLWRKWFNDLGYSRDFTDFWTSSINATFTKSWLEVDSFPAPHRNSFDLTGEWTNFLHLPRDINLTIGVLGTFVKGQEESGLPLAPTLDTTQASFSAYLQGDWQIVPQVKIIAGVQGNKAADLDFDVNPRLGLIWSPADIVNVKALYSTAFRAPTIMELYLDHPTLKGNPDLEPEKIKTADLGVNIQTDKVFTGINFFYSEVLNTITRTNTVPGVYENREDPTTFIGLEVEGRVQIVKGLTLMASGLLQQNTNGDSVGNMMPVPEASAKGGISYSGYGFTASVFNIYEGRLDSRYDATYNKTREAFDLLNANIKYEVNRLFKLEAPVITLEVEGYNLLDEEIWLPATGMPIQHSVPAVEGISVYFGVGVAF